VARKVSADEYERQRDKMATILWRKRKKYTDGE
jgi:hypothetical protein